jgi:hypothetical protein
MNGRRISFQDYADKRALLEYDAGQQYRVTGDTAGTAMGSESSYLKKGLGPLAQAIGIDLNDLQTSDPDGSKRQALLDKLPAIAYRVLFPDQMQGNRVQWSRAGKDMSQMQQPTAG